MTRLVIKHGRVIDPSHDLDREMHVVIEGGRVASLHAIDEPVPAGDETIDASHRIVAPGFIDLGTELREPGFEEDETIASGTAAAIAGGYTSLASLPNTDPPVDSQASVEFIQHQAERAGHCHVFVLACISKHREGAELTEMGLLAQAGAVGFTDAPAPIDNAELMRRALEYSQMFDRPIFNRPEVSELNRDGVMHEGFVSTLLGLSGMPAEAEDVMTARDIRLAEATGGRIHLLNLSTSGSVELLRRAHARGVPVTAGINIANLVLTDESLRPFDSRFKVNPPLRSQDHIDACLAGLIDKTIDVICSGHTPRAAEKKMDVLDGAPFGAVGLETTLGVVATKLIEPGHLTWGDAIAKLSTRPAEILGLTAKGTLQPGSDADIVIIDPNASWKVSPDTFYSSSVNTPFDGWVLRARPTDVIVSGQIRLRDGIRTAPVTG